VKWRDAASQLWQQVGFSLAGRFSPFHPGKKVARRFFLPQRKTDPTLGDTPIIFHQFFPMRALGEIRVCLAYLFSLATVTEVHLTDEGYSMPVADAVSLNRLCLGFFLHAGVAPIREKPMETPKEQKYNLPGTLNNGCLVKQPFFM